MLTNAQVKELVRKSEDSTSLSRGDSASLRLNKFADTNSRNKLVELKEICKLAERQKVLPRQLTDDTTFQMKLGGRLIVDHSGGILENAGICLHNFFNYPMIPGSALKGITRHYARGINADKDDIKRIFGDDAKGGGDSGTVAFLAAVPADTEWQLVPDILTPHKDDLHNPVPIQFIAVEKGATFQFTLKKTLRGTDADLQTAIQWLKAALVENGVGGKTSSGYGRFIGNSTDKDIELKLITPGFFGGADPYKQECTGLRISSLRGMLRYWWRIAMAEYLSDDMSKELENLLWGHTSRAGLVRLSIKQSGESVQLFNYKDKYRVESNFARQHEIDSQKSGLHYLAYGMDEISCSEKKQRYYVEAGAEWLINLSVREKGLKNEFTDLTSEDVEKHALLALSLLCRFGGIGSKSRKGFGSLHWSGAWSLEECRQVAGQFAGKLKQSSSVINMDYSFGNIIQETIEISTRDAWRAIDKLGYFVKEFASEKKHNEHKAALGLPRKIHGPQKFPLKHQSEATYQGPLKLKTEFERFASPIWYHFEPSGNGLKLNILAFPSGKVVDADASRTMLDNLLEHLKRTLTAEVFPVTTARSVANAQRQQSTTKPIAYKTAEIKVGSKITGELLEEKTKGGGWKVKTEELDTGCIQNYGDVPMDKKPGDVVNLEVRQNRRGAAQFKWMP